MSPTLLEGAAVIVLLAVAWQIGVQWAPSFFRAAKHANDQLAASSAEVEQIILTGTKDKEPENKTQGTKSRD